VVDLDDSDHASHALLPALARRPEVLGDDPEVGRLRGIYRRSWVHNAILRNRTQPVLRLMVDAGLPMALLGASAMPRFLGDDAGICPIEAVDLLTRPGDAGRATRMLVTGGCSNVEPGEFVLRGGGDARIRLHTRVVATSIGRHADDALWATVTRGPDGMYEVDAAHLLLHLLTSQAAEGIAWVADAHHLSLAVHSPTGLVSIARAHHVVRRCVERLDVVAQVTGTATHIEALRGRGPRILERLGRKSSASRARRGAALVAAHAAGGGGLARGLASAVGERYAGQPR